MKKKKIKQSEIDAIEDCKRRLRTALAAGKFKDAADIHNQLGNTYRLIGRHEDALEEHLKEVEVCKNFNKRDKMGLGIAYRNIAEVYIDMKEEDKAIPYIKQYLKLAQEKENFVEEQRAYITLGRTYLYKADKEGMEDDPVSRNTQLDSAESYFRRAYKLMSDTKLKEQLNNEREFMTMKCNNCQNLGLTLETKGKLSEAVMWLSKAIEIGKKCSLYEYLQPCNSVLATIYLKLNNPKEALGAAKDSVLAAKSHGNLNMEIESLILQSKALFCLDDIENGKKILRKVRKTISSKEEFATNLEDVESLLISATKISRRLDTVFSTDSTDYMTLQQLHECMGDNYANLCNFDEAVKHYLKSVEFAEASGVGVKKLSRLYFSIAETYKDKDDFANALENYEKEMEMHEGNPDEKFKTQTNITMVLEKLKRDQKEVIDAHHKAISLAKEAESIKKEATALQNFGLYLRSINKVEESKKILKKVEQIKKDNNLTDLEEIEQDSQDLLDGQDNEIDLNNLTSGDETEEDENSEDKNVACTKSKRKVGQRKNEAGESPLHLAAKRGDLTAVKRLIRQGHEVHIRDTAGWTPLHEAANFGNAEVVTELIKHGARVNDRGGSLCDGITPLHDALGNGHFAVADVLLKNEANVLALDESKNLPMDHLVIWRRSNGHDAEGDVYEDYKRIKNILREQMRMRGRPYTTNDEVKAAKKSKARCTSPKFSLMRSNDQNEESFIPIKIAGDDFDPDNATEATDFYKSTIKGLMRQEDPKTRKKPNPRPISPGPRTALIPDNLDVHENWMTADDVFYPEMVTRSKATNVPKRKRDPTEDFVLKERATRRRRNEQRLLLDVDEIDIPRRRGRLRNSIGDEQGQSSPQCNNENDNELQDNEDDPVIDLMDLGRESGEECSVKSAEIRNSDENSGTPNHGAEDEFDFELMSSSFSNERLTPEVLPYLDEDFMPSQAPSTSAVVFGRLNDHEDSEMDRNEDLESQMISKPRNRPKHFIQSSDEEDFRENETINKSKKGNSFSSIAAAFSKINPSSSSGLSRTGNNRNGKSSSTPIQTRLPFKRISAGNGNRSESSPSPEFVRTLSSSSLRQVNNKPGEILRLKIRVLEHILLVPVEEENLGSTVAWLCQECSIRYLRAHGVKPILTLSTKDGAQLSASDPISLVLGGNEVELVATVTSYDLPPLTERFQTNCTEMGIGGPDVDILASLNMCQSSNILNLYNFNLRGSLARAVFQSLQRHHSLRELNLSGCSLLDDGFKELCKVLPTLPGLAALDISLNGVTAGGFQSFCELLVTDTGSLTSKKLIGLSSLSFSHNPLGNRIAPCFAELLNYLLNLKCLGIADCEFTEKLLIGQNELQTSFNKSRLEELDISYNNWGEIGMEKLLQNLNPSRIRSLNCGSPGVKEEEETFSRILANFFSRNEDCCNLKELKLSDCGFTDSSLRNITEHFNRLVSLEALDLTNNEMITAISIEEILTQCQVHNIPLTRLDAGCCPSLWESSIAPERILLALDRKLQTERKMLYLRLTVDGTPNFEQTDTNLSKLETRMARLWEDYSGNLNSSCKKVGNNTVYEYE